MTKKEWQKHYGFSDEDMKFLEYVIKLFNAKIVSVFSEGK